MYGFDNGRLKQEANSRKASCLSDNPFGKKVSYKHCPKSYGNAAKDIEHHIEVLPVFQ